MEQVEVQLAPNPGNVSERMLHEKGEKYVLPVDNEEHERLRLQQKVIKEAASGRVLFPPYNKSKSYFVLDVGVGPAAWLTDVAALLSPTSVLHGVDVSSHQFPKIRPSNMSFSICSALSLPTIWEKSFDIVHQRLLVGALKASEYPEAIKQMYRVLRPGGWIQLGEIGNWTPPASPESAISRHKRIHYAFFESRGLDLDIYAKLPKLLADAGFIKVKVEVLRIPMGKLAGPAGIDGSRNLIGVFRALRLGIVGSGGFGIVNSVDEYDKLIDDLEKEWDETEGFVSEFHIVYAQRPEDVCQVLDNIA